MVGVVARVLVVFLTTFLAMFEVEAAEVKKIALVVGNGDYLTAPRLENPGRDAGAVAAALRRIGFEVLEANDLKKAAFDESLRRFGGIAADADIALFYFAGHAMQFEGANFLLPVDAALASSSTLPFETIRLDAIQASLSQTKGLRLIILDSCRDNPLELTLKQATSETRSSGMSRGLSRVAANDGSVVVFSTQAGRVADDGQSGNSPFTKALLKHIEAPDLEVGLLLRRIASDVSSETNGDQLPEISISLRGEFYLSGNGAGAAAEVEIKPAPSDDRSIEIALWESAEKIGKIEGYEAYRRQFPEGIFKALADLRVQELKMAALPPASTPPPGESRESDKATTSSENSEVSLNLTKKDRLAIEAKLLRAGFNPGDIDGELDLDGRAAIRSWQYTNDFEPTGFLDSSQLAKLVGPRNGAGEAITGLATAFAEAPDGADPRLVSLIERAKGQPFTYTIVGKKLFAALTVHHGGGGISFFDARKRAEELGGQLATVTSASENRAIFGIIKDDDRFWWLDPDGGFYSGPWIGYFQAPGAKTSKQGWTWVDKSKSRFTAWGKGQPNEIDLKAGPGAAAYGGEATSPPSTWQDPILMKQGAPGFVMEID